jgi:hypothetical protein
MDPYLPDIMEGVVARVSAAFEARDDDPFPVFFDKGVYSQVCKNIYANNPDSFPLVWLIMPYTMKRQNFAIYGEVRCEIVIAMPTDSKFTQQQRDDFSFKPRLIPIYEVLMQEIAREKWFSFKPGIVTHNQTIRPYWGGGDVNGSDTPNLFKKEVDAISISNLTLSIKRQNCSVGDYPINQNTNYQQSPYILSFEDDIELIVDGGRSDDPVAGQASVIIPRLIGRDYDVYQRGFGQLRKERSVEFIKDETNGGFALTGGKLFATADTYIVKIRPSYVVNEAGPGTSKIGIKSFFIGKNT